MSKKRSNLNKGIEEFMRAKFIVDSVTLFGSTPYIKVEMTPVLIGSEENHKFFSSTPTGNLSLTIKNPVLKEFFQPNKEFYLDFIECD